MKTYRVGICDSDADYMMSVMDAINASSASGLGIVAFSGMQAVKDYLSVDDLDLILTDNPDLCDIDERGTRCCDVPVVQLTDYIDDSRGWQNTDSKIVTIYKYQAVTKIMKLIRQQLDVSRNDVRQVADVIAVYSPIGRSGKTKLAKTFASYDDVRGGLYISMEDFSDRPDELSTEILYLLKTNVSDLGDAIARHVIHRDGIQMLYVMGTYMDARDVSALDIEVLKGKLLESGKYSSIVIDFGSASINDLQIFGCFDKIYMPVLRDKQSVKKIEVFLKLLKDTGNRSLISRLISVDVPDVPLGSPELMKTVWDLKVGTYKDRDM